MATLSAGRLFSPGLIGTKRIAAAAASLLAWMGLTGLTMAEGAGASYLIQQRPWGREHRAVPTHSGYRFRFGEPIRNPKRPSASHYGSSQREAAEGKVAPDRHQRAPLSSSEPVRPGFRRRSRGNSARRRGGRAETHCAADFRRRFRAPGLA